MCPKENVFCWNNWKSKILLIKIYMILGYSV